MEINEKLRQYFIDNVSELIELVNENRDNPNLNHLYYRENDEDFLDYYFDGNTISEIIETVLSNDNPDLININDAYIKDLGDGRLETLSEDEYKNLLLENLDYIMSYIDSEDLSSKALEAYNGGHVMYCSECKCLIKSVTCNELSKTENTLSLDYDNEGDKVALYDNEDDQIIEREEYISLHCEECGNELNEEQYEFIMNLCNENDISI